MPEYEEALVPADFRLSHEKPNDVIPAEIEYAQQYGVSPAKMLWRRNKIAEFSADGSDGALRYAQEYPISADEAFLGGSGDTFISPAVVEAARLRATAIHAEVSQHPIILGLDCAPPHGKASSALVWRCGRIAFRIERYRGLGAERLAMQVYEEAMRCQAARICVDASEGTGIEVVTHLQRFGGVAGNVVAVKFGDPAFDRALYANVRAEIWSKMADWLRKDAAIVDERPEPGQASLASELLSTKPKTGGEKRITLESKDDLRRRGIPSPDGADALATTFFYPDPAPHQAMGVVQAPHEWHAPSMGYTHGAGEVVQAPFGT